MIRRNITSEIFDALVVLLNGARQTGKSTLVRAIIEGDHLLAISRSTMPPSSPPHRQTPMVSSDP